ncbi:EF-hand domain-containing protein [Sphingomonas floccifaciens]|uniref:EF-hand domain-containing protein n=1 Tax=Sphingomonas floccifaciens TaxID=1844115 RepID=A0ABW4N8M4_9SPHN
MLPLLLLFAVTQAAASAPPRIALDGRETEPSAVVAATRLHQRMDANHDGYVTPQEMATFVTHAMNGLPIPGTDAAHPLPPVPGRVFAAANSDHDGRISLAETIAEAPRTFALEDVNHDGTVTPDERMAFLKRVIDDGGNPPGLAHAPSPKPPAARR